MAEIAVRNSKKDEDFYTMLKSRVSFEFSEDLACNVCHSLIQYT